MDKRVVVGLILGVVFILGALIFFQSGSSNQPDGGDIVSVGTNLNLEGGGTADSGSQATGGSDGSSAAGNSVEITSSGFGPGTLTISVGESVTWTNEGSSPSWPASDMHPSHTGYSGTSLSEHCPDSQNNAFDACRGLGSGESYTFTFNKAGTWQYHDHLRPSHTGTIIVQ